MIYLYHGTDLEFDTPIPERGRRGTDFGQGFYLTPHLESAVNMAHRVARRKNSLGVTFDKSPQLMRHLPDSVDILRNLFLSCQH